MRTLAHSSDVQVIGVADPDGLAIATGRVVVGCVILAVNGQPVHTVHAVVDTLHSAEPGRSLSLQLLHPPRAQPLQVDEVPQQQPEGVAGTPKAEEVVKSDLEVRV